MLATMEKARQILGIDWSSGSRARVVVLVVLGTLVCIAVAFAVDSYDFATGAWRWGKDPVNNLVIPSLLAPPFFYLLLEKMRQLAIAHGELLTVAATDSLTSVLNRRAFTEIVDGYLKRIEESEKASESALLVIDVDHFKDVNDQFGHDKGDEALQLIAATIRAAVRETDLVGRMGGEEFSVFMPAQPPGRASAVAERIRMAISEAVFSPGGVRHGLSVSVGGVAFNRAQSFGDLYRVADEWLYVAKRSGRNRVEFRKQEPGTRLPLLN